MTVGLHNLSRGKEQKRAGKRVGRGNASGKGTTAARGTKGQRARSGGKKGLKYKGLKRNIANLPKFKGNKSLLPENQVVRTSQLNNLADGFVVTPQSLIESKLVKSAKLPIKILFDAEIKVKISVSGCRASKTAIATIEKAGGQVSLPTPKAPTTKKNK